jgi:hypothetical protein
MRSILEVAKELNLSAEDFRELVNEGRLDGMQLDRDCVERVRRMFVDAARKRPTEH